MPTVSAYEKKRLERIKANEEFLSNLNVSENKKRLRTQKPQRPPAKRKATTGKRKSIPAKPTRASSRLKGEQADDIEISNESGGKVFISKTRMGGKNLSISDLITESGKIQEEARQSSSQAVILDDKLHTVGDRLQQVLMNLGEELQDPATAMSGQNMSKYQEHLSKLEVPEHGVIKVTPEAVYSLVLHPSSTQKLAIAGDKSGTVGIWDFRNTSADEEASDVSTFRPHKSTVNRLLLHHNDPATVLTISYDGFIKAIDLASQDIRTVFDQSQVEKVLDASGTWLQHGTFGASSSEITLGFSNGMVIHWDVRQGGKPAWSAELHEKKVQTVDWSPDFKTLCTASLDRSVKLWDARMLQKGNTPNPLFYMDDSNSVNCAYFNCDGSAIAAVTQSNRIAVIHDPTSKSEKVIADYNIRHDNRTGRWLPVFHLAWDPRSSHSFVVGSMAKPRRADVYTLDFGAQKLSATHIPLEDDYFASVHSRYAFHRTQDIIACGNSSGRVTVFE